MPAYFFHLALELSKVASDFPELAGGTDQASFIRPNLDLFGPSLPTHTSSTWTSYVAPKRIGKSNKTDTFSKRSSAVSGQRDRSPPPLAQNSDRTSCREHTHELDRVVIPIESEEEHQTLEGKDFLDHRLDRISVESVDMQSQLAVPGTESSEQNATTHASPLGLKGKYIPSDPKTTEFGWGVIHLYRDVSPSTELEDEPEHLSATDTSEKFTPDSQRAYVDDDCTTLCILAVPAYMTPSDLLGWLGESTLELVSHFRLVRTSRSNRYMVLIKFRGSKAAKKWQHDWNGRLFNSMEPENCHIVFVRSIQFQESETRNHASSFPDMSNDPFTPDTRRNGNPSSGDTNATAEPSQTSTSLTAKPVPPPTPALIELPTCPVCLERMDETNGLATIFCQHVFHCACLQKWQGNGCPVCRYTQNDHLHGSRAHDAAEDQCRVCGSSDNLWMCLICGHVGCGRYDEAHAFAHFEQTSHSFAMDLTTQVIWDYIGDEYVHRLIQNKSDGKLVELPSSTAKWAGNYPAVPEEKLENMGMEYSNLLKGQLDSQRFYFEEQVDRAVDKASEATAAADRATAGALKATERLEAVQSSYDMLLKETLPALERDKERASSRAEKFEGMARKMEKEWKEKEVINESLMDRISHLEKQVNEMTLKNSDLEEQNRDLSFFISGMEKLKDQGADVQEGTLQVADPPATGKKKKGKGKK